MSSSISSRRHKFFHYYPAAVLVLCLTFLFWGFLAIFILPVQEAYIQQKQLMPHAIFTGLIAVTKILVTYFWIIPVLLAGILIAFEKMSATDGFDRLRQRKKLIYAINTILLLLTGLSYAVSSLFWSLNI